jgi:hypothetical protein
VIVTNGPAITLVSSRHRSGRHKGHRGGDCDELIRHGTRTPTKLHGRVLRPAQPIQSASEVRACRRPSEWSPGHSGLRWARHPRSFPVKAQPQRIDTLTFAIELSFEQAFSARTTIEIGGVVVPFPSVDDLRTNNLATGRLRDRADAAELGELHSEENWDN